MSAVINQSRKRILHDYRISITLGEGAFSKVKLAVHRQTELKVSSNSEGVQEQVAIRPV